MILDPVLRAAIELGIDLITRHLIVPVMVALDQERTRTGLQLYGRVRTQREIMHVS